MGGWGSLPFSNPFKINNQETKKYILNSLIEAHKLSVHKKIDGFINCPIDKKVFNRNIGVTEFLSKLNRSLGTEVMMIYNEKFAVVPLTTHIDVKNISQSIFVILMILFQKDMSILKVQ